MRIWIEAGLIARGGWGSRRYAVELAGALAAAGEDVRLIARDGGLHRENGIPGRHTPGDRSGIRVRSRAPALDPRLLHGLWAFAPWPPLTSVVGGPRPDVVHAAEKGGVPPVPRRTPLVVTVHDVWCLIRPDACRGRLGFLVRRSWKRRARWDLVITPSEATRRELLGLGFPEGRVQVVPSGIGDSFVGPPVHTGPLLERFGLHEPSLVYVGPLSRKKGGDILLAALYRLRRSREDLRLVVRGADTFEDVAPSLDRRIIEAVRPAMTFLPALSDTELAALYRQAAAVVCPSRMEGYNFPLVEALAVGARVVATDIPAHREVSRGAAILVPPEDSGELAAGIERALSGPSPAGGFVAPRWEDTAKGTLAVYREALARA